MLTLPPTLPTAIGEPLTALISAVRFLYQQGWTPATSSNFSIRDPENDQQFWISISGKDKGQLTVDDFMALTQTLQVVYCNDSAAKPSAETKLHQLIYHRFPEANTVLHCHSVNATVLSKLFETQGGIALMDFEILKGFRGVTSHTAQVFMPIFANDQDMQRLSDVITQWLDENPQPCYGFLLAGHGLYTWGQTTEEARRHTEVFEFIFDCILKLKAHGHPNYS